MGGIRLALILSVVVIIAAVSPQEGPDEEMQRSEHEHDGGDEHERDDGGDEHDDRGHVKVAHGHDGDVHDRHGHDGDVHDGDVHTRGMSGTIIIIITFNSY